MVPQRGNPLSCLEAWKPGLYRSKHFILLSCTWEKLGKERERNKTHGTVRVLKSKVTSHLGWAGVPDGRSCLQRRHTPPFRRDSLSEAGFCAGGQSLWSCTIQSRGKRLWEEQSQLCFDNSRITPFIKSKFNFVFICGVNLLCWYLRVQTITSRLTGFFG